MLKLIKQVYQYQLLTTENRGRSDYTVLIDLRDDFYTNIVTPKKPEELKH